MLFHRTYRHRLYDYLTGTLSPEETQSLEEHLRSCRRCARELRDLRSAVEAIGPASTPPAEKLPEEFWRELADGIDRGIAGNGERKSLAADWDDLLLWLVGRRLWIYGGSAVAVIALAAVLLLKPGEQPQTAGGAVATVSPFVRPADDTGGTREVRTLASDYFRKSKALLVGLNNKKIDLRSPVDLSAEQQLSRQLLHDARYLKQQPLDDHSSRLIDDMDRIFIELANREGGRTLPDIELIRSGIRQENLLFKIRMAEAQFDTSSVAAPGRGR